MRRNAEQEGELGKWQWVMGKMHAQKTSKTRERETIERMTTTHHIVNCKLSILSPMLQSLKTTPDR